MASLLINEKLMRGCNGDQEMSKGRVEFGETRHKFLPEIHIMLRSNDVEDSHIGEISDAALLVHSPVEM